MRDEEVLSVDPADSVPLTNFMQRVVRPRPPTQPQPRPQPSPRPPPAPAPAPAADPAQDFLDMHGQYDAGLGDVGEDDLLDEAMSAFLDPNWL